MASIADGTIIIQGEAITFPDSDAFTVYRTRGDISGGGEPAGGIHEDNANFGGTNDNTGPGKQYDDFGLWAGYTGDGYLDINGNAQGTRASFTFEGEEGTNTYSVTFRVANGSNANGVSGDRPLGLVVNEGTADEVLTDAQNTNTGDWDIWEYRTFDVTVTGVGPHTIGIQQLSTGSANIDAVAVHEAGTEVILADFAGTPIIDPIVLDGPDATITNDSVAPNTAASTQAATLEDGEPGQGGDKPLDQYGLRVGYTDTGYIDFGSNSGDTATWTIEVDEAGQYDLHVRYASSDAGNGEARLLDLVAGETQVASLEFPGPDFDVWQTLTVRVDLTADVNVVSLAIPANRGNGPNIDAIALTHIGGTPTFAPVNTAPDLGAVETAPTIDENAATVGSYAAPDADADTVTYDLSGDDADLFTIDAEGNLVFDTAPDAEDPQDADEDNVYDVTVEARDDVLVSTADVSVTVANVNEDPSALAGTASTTEDNAVEIDLADLIADPEEADGELTIDASSDDGTVEQTGTVLTFTPNADFSGEATIDYTVTDGEGATASASVSVIVAADDDAPTSVELSPIAVDENAAGAVVADIVITDVDGTLGTPTVDDTVTFRVIGAPGAWQLALAEDVFLDAEAANQPQAVVTVDGVSSEAFTPQVDDVDEAPQPIDVVFSAAGISTYQSVQDQPEDGGGIDISEDGAAITLDGNLWKRAALPNTVTITENTRLAVDVSFGDAIPEIAAIGFDDDDNPFERSDESNFMVGLSQNLPRWAVDIRGTGTDLGGGVVQYVIDVSGLAGKTFDSLTLVADDDKFSNGQGSVTFANVSIFEQPDDAGNAAPRVVGGGIVDFAINEGDAIEVDVPFVDDDGDALTFSYVVLDANDQPVTVEGLAIADGVLAGPAPADAGVYTVTITASDGEASETTSFVLDVQNVNDAPVADDVALEPYFFEAGDAIDPIDLGQFEGFFDDPDGDQLILSAEGLPAGLSVNDEGVIVGRPTEGGTFDVIVRATDAGGLSDTISIQIAVDGGAIGDTITVEAEDFTGLADAENFRATGKAGASGNGMIKVNGGQAGAVITDLSAGGVPDGWYTVAIDVFDELDGSATFSLSVGDTELTADGASFDDEGTLLNPDAGRGGAGQLGNLKRFSFETPVFVEAGTILSYSGQADGEHLRTDRVLLTRVEEPVFNEAPEAPVLAGDAVAENVDGATVGTLSAVDPDGDDATVTFSVAAESIFEVDGTTLKLKDGEAFDFETAQSATVEVTAADANGGTASATFTIQVSDVDEAPETPTLTGGIVAENAEGAAVGTLSAVDPEGQTPTFSTDDARFEIVGDALRLAPGTALDFEAGEIVTVAVTATDAGGATTGDVTVTVTDANDVPTLAADAALDDVTVDFGAGATIPLAALGATDQDAADTFADETLSFDLRAADGGTLPAGIAILNGAIVLPETTPAGTYGIEVFATDGEADSDSVSFTVTVGDAPPFQPVTIQLENRDGSITILDTDQPGGGLANTDLTQVRDAQNPEPDGTGKVNGLWPGFEGTGYLDMGGDIGDAFEFTINVPEDGEYVLDFRFNQGSGSTPARPMTLSVDGTDAATLQFPSNNDWTMWQTEAATVTLQAGDNVIRLTNTIANGPNFDSVTVSLPTDDSADADDFPLELGGIVEGSTLGETQAASINFNVSGDDDDIVKYEVSFDDGTTRIDVTSIVDSDGDFVVDGSGLPDGATTARIIVTDAAGNEAFDELSFTIDRGDEPADPIVIQAEDETLVTVLDSGTGPTDGSFTREAGIGNPDAFDNERQGAVGDAYIDYGTNPDDALSVAIDAPATGTYDLTIRYANGASEVRPLALSVNGGTPSNVAFASTGLDDPGWENWTDLTISVDLNAGPNTVSLAIPTVANGGVGNGPNIDQFTFELQETVEPTDAQVFEEIVKINFEAPLAGNGNFNAPAGYTTPEGFESDIGEAYGARDNGFAYGWVDIDDAAGTVTDTPKAQPTGSMRYKDVVTEASDLQKTYAHFEYPGAPAADRERAWEIELASGTYELTVAIGDTAGKYDSNYVINVEGQSFGPGFTPVANDGVDYGNQFSDDIPPPPAYDNQYDGEGFRSNLYTGVVQVTDGRLTIDSLGGDNTEIQWLDIDLIPDLTPNDGRTADLDYSKFVSAVAASTEDGQVTIELGSDGTVPLGIDPTSSLVVGVELQAQNHRGPAVAFTDGIKLIETVTGEEVAINAQVTGGADSLTIRPLQELKEFTSYTLVIEDVLDLGNLTDSSLPQRQMQDYTTTFVTGEAPEVTAREVAFTDQVVLDGFAQGGVAFTSIEFGPDGKLYTSSITGVINRWDLNADGTVDLASNEVLNLDYFSDTGRSIIGMIFDPEDPNVIWVSDNAPVPRQGKADETPEFSGQISKITLGDNGSFEGASAETYITGLPRSGGDHVTNSLEFRNVGTDEAPDYLLYVMQGSNSAAGRPDDAWGYRPERLLNAAALEIDPRREAPEGGFDVQTEPYDPTTDAPTFPIDPNDESGDPRPLDEFNADGTYPGFYDPFAEDAVLKIFGEGIRNGYDLVWHSNGNLYVPTNGTARGGNTLDDPNTTDVNERISNLDKQFDYLFQVQEGGYYGHPNDLLGHYVVNGGAGGAPNIYGSDNAANTSDGGNEYNSNVERDAEYDIDGSYSLGFNKSPNGAVEYTGDAFGSNLKGAVLFAQFSVGDNVRVINVDPVTGRVTGDDVLRRPDGNVIDEYIDPLDIIENPLTGQLYLMTLNRGSGQSQIVLLNPAPGGVVADDTADENGDLSLSVVDASDEAAVIFAVTGLDDDIVTTAVSVDGGPSQTVDVQNGQFTLDLSGEDGEVSVVLSVTDEVPNSATASATVTPGDDSGVQVIDAIAFTVLSDLTGIQETLIRRIDDPDTYETSSGNDANGDGMNDGYDGTGYLDPNGPAEDKASFDVTVAQSGTYTLVFRMASNSDRSVAIETGGQSVPIDVNTTDFTNWTDYPITLRLEEGTNTVVIAQTSATGPNIDSVTVTPDELDDPVVPNDGTVTENGITYSIHEAETADLDGAVVVADDERNERGDFVDFNGTADQSVTWTVSAPETGSYAVDIFYALSAGKDARPMTLSVDGVPRETLSFAPNSNQDENVWGPQNAIIQLAAGTREITVTAPGANGPNLDYLRISQQPLDGPIDNSADAGDPLTLTVIDQSDAANVVFEVTGDDADIQSFEVAFNGGDPVAVTLDANGRFTADTGVAIGVIDAVLTVTDGVGNTATAEADFSVAPDGDEDAEIEVQSLDATFFSDRLHFSWIDDPAEFDDSTQIADRDFKASGTVRLSNPGTETLEVLSSQIDGPFVLADPGQLDGLTIAAGASVDVEVLFDRDAFTPPTGNRNQRDAAQGVIDGALTLVTNDADSPVATVDLAAFWQPVPESGWEPNVNEVWEMFGFGNVIEGLSALRGGENSILSTDDVFASTDETEVLSPYWRIADGATEARITQIAAYHGPGGAPLAIHNPNDDGGGSDLINFWNHQGTDNQRILPNEGGGFATELFTRADIPDGWNGDDVFGVKVANLSTDPRLNPTGDVTVPGEQQGHTVKVFQAVDQDGVAIENTFLIAQDYTGINYDYNDNLYVMEGVAPVFFGGSVSVSGLDDAAADDRLVFTNIDNPDDGGGLIQTFRNEATFTLTNDGIGTLNVTDLRIEGDDTAFEIVGDAPTVLAEGESADITVQFVGSDPTGADNAAVSYGATLVVETDAQAPISIALAGLAQNQSEQGEEPTVAEIVAALGYSTDVAQGDLNGGGTVETVGDEVLMPYLQRLDDGAPVEVINLAAFLQQGDVSRLNLHELDSDGLTELFAGDDQQGQTILPDGLVPDAGDTGSVGRADIDRDAPFGLKVTVDGRPTFAAWTDPEANKADPELGVNDGGHYIRFFQAKDAAGADIPGTFIGIQDYPGGGNFDYNDAVFLVRNVQPYDPAGAEDADGNGVVDVLETDQDNDGLVAFFDDDDAPVTAAQTPFPGPDAPGFQNGSLTIDASNFDEGGQDVAYNDGAGLAGGTDGGRGNGDVEQTPLGDIGWISTGEWLEYTIDVDQAGAYELSLLLANGSSSTGTATVEVYRTGEASPYLSTDPISNPNSGGWTTYLSRDGGELDLEAGEQILRVTFSGSQDFRSFTLDQVSDPTDGQAPFGGTAPIIGADAVTIDAETFDAGGQGISWNDNDGRLGSNGFRTDTDVDLVGGDNDIGYVEAGEWVEYTVFVEEAGTYDLSVNAKTPIGGNSVAVSLGDGPALATFALPDSNGGSTGFGGTTFAETAAQQVDLAAGEQTLRVTFDGDVASNGYLLDYRGLTLDKVEDAAPSGPVGEAGSVTFAQPDGDTWFQVSFTEALDNPSVVMGPFSFNGAEPVVARVRNVTDTGFEYQMDEWDYLGGGHTTETVSWLAIEEGTHQIGGQTFVAGSGSAAGKNTSLDFGTAIFGADAPVVLAQVASDNDPAAVTAQISSVGGSGFTLDLDREEAANAAHGTETVSWIAAQEGGSAASGLLAGEIGGVTHVGTNIDFGGDFADDFVFLADMQTENGSDAADLRLTDIDAGSATLFVEEEESEDTETNHTSEDVGYVALSAGLIFADSV